MGPCFRICVPRCFCKKGYIRDEKTGDCVSDTQCNKNEYPHPKCKKHEILDWCTSRCAVVPTCQNPKPEPHTGPCTLECVPRCLCKKGFIRNHLTGKCIRRYQCQFSKYSGIVLNYINIILSYM